MTPLLLTGIVAAGAEVFSRAFSSESAAWAKGHDVVNSFSHVLSTAKEFGNELNGGLVMHNIQTAKDLSERQDGLTKKLLESPELAGHTGPFRLEKNIDGQFYITTGAGIKVMLQSGTESVELAEGLHQLNHLEELSAQLPGARLADLAKQVEQYPRNNAIWNLREINV